MPAPFTPVRVPRDPNECAPWLYEALKRLNRHAVQTSLGLASVGRGEAPDGSGEPLPSPDLTDYFYLPGRTGGQLGYGDVDPNGLLTLSSTAHASKGFIYLGESAPRVAFDEAECFFGIGTDAPAYKAHVVGASTAFTLLPTTNIGNNWGVVGVLPDAISTDDGDTSYIEATGNGSVENCEVNIDDPDDLANVTSLTLHMVARKVDSGGGVRGVTFRLVDNQTGPHHTIASITQSLTLLTQSYVEYTYALSAAELADYKVAPGFHWLVILDSSQFDSNEIRVTAVWVTGTTGSLVTIDQTSSDVLFLQCRDSSDVKVMSVSPEGTLLMENGVSSAPRALIKANASQSVDFFRVTSSAELNYLAVSSTGVVTAGNTTSPTNGIKLIVQASASQSVDCFRVQNSTPVTMFSVGSTGLTTIGGASTATGVVKLAVTGATSQTVDLMNINAQAAGSVQTAWNFRNVMATGRIKALSGVLFTDDNATIASARLAGLDTSLITPGQTRSFQLFDRAGVVATDSNVAVDDAGNVITADGNIVLA